MKKIQENKIIRNSFNCEIFIKCKKNQSKQIIVKQKRIGQSFIIDNKLCTDF